MLSGSTLLRNLTIKTIIIVTFIEYFICDFLRKSGSFPANIYFFKVNDRSTRKRCSEMFKVNNKHQNDVNDVALMFLILTLNRFDTFF